MFKSAESHSLRIQSPHSILQKWSKCSACLRFESSHPMIKHCPLPVVEPTACRSSDWPHSHNLQPTPQPWTGSVYPCHEQCNLTDSPLEEEQIEVVVLLGEEVSQNPSGIATADLIGREGEVYALDEVPQLGHRILTEHPAESQEKWWTLLSSCKPYQNQRNHKEFTLVILIHTSHIETQIAQGNYKQYNTRADRTYSWQMAGHIVRRLFGKVTVRIWIWGLVASADTIFRRDGDHVGKLERV